MSRALLAALDKLTRTPERYCAGSALTRAQRKALDDLAARTGCVQVQSRANGVVYRVVDPELLYKHLRQLQPIAPAEVDETLPARAANIAVSRSSKSAAHRHDSYYLLLKAVASDVTWRNEEGVALDLTRATRHYGAAVLGIRSTDGWSTDRPLWLVENQALFDRLDWLPPAIGGSVHGYGGKLHNLLLDWLAARPRAPRVILFPDYDGVGLNNYARLRKRLSESCELWLMPNWQSCLKRFGNPSLWRKTLDDFQAAQHHLRETPPPAEVRELVNALQQQGLALEQEAVWL